MWGEMADLRDSVVLVTDASGGVGRGIAEGLAEAGATLYLATRLSGAEAADAIGSTVAAVEALGGRALSVQIDLEDDEALLECFRRLESESGRLDVLINNLVEVAAPSVRSSPFWTQPFESWDVQCGPSLRDCYVASALAARLMVEQGSGLIVNLTGVLEAQDRANPASSVLESGGQRMSTAMAQELGPHGVTAMTLDAGTLTAQAECETDDGQRRTPRFAGRALAALAMDPDVHQKTGGRFQIEDLRSEYRFSELAPPTEITEASS